MIEMVETFDSNENVLYIKMFLKDRIFQLISSDLPA